MFRGEAGVAWKNHTVWGGHTRVLEQCPEPSWGWWPARGVSAPGAEGGIPWVPLKENYLRKGWRSESWCWVTCTVFPGELLEAFKSTENSWSFGKESLAVWRLWKERISRSDAVCLCRALGKCLSSLRRWEGQKCPEVSSLARFRRRDAFAEGTGRGAVWVGQGIQRGGGKNCLKMLQKYNNAGHPPPPGHMVMARLFLGPVSSSLPLSQRVKQEGFALPYLPESFLYSWWQQTIIKWNKKGRRFISTMMT